MLKKFSGIFASAACLMALSCTAFAQTGAVGSAVGGVVDAGEDIADGIFNAGDDLVRGVTGGRTGDTGSSADGDSAADSDVDDLTSPDEGDTSGDTGTSGGDTSTDDGNTSTDSGDNAIGDTSDGSANSVEESGEAGNPTTGDVTMGYAAMSAVLAALGVTVTSIRRKQD